MLGLENDPMAVASTLDTILKMKDITMWKGSTHRLQLW